jgi:GTP diphosphokinase / guanosine-3',5'-bis(diphosphate) 3'-diphosphatase
MNSPAKLLHALAFAADRHRDQRRKGGTKSPYINHPIAVAEVLAGAGKVTNEALLVAAILHDTVEDTQTTSAELKRRFGADVAHLVKEVTDDKSLPKQVRKRLQIEHAASTSPRGKLLKIADKICNLRELGTHPPPGWSAKRRAEYVIWADWVVSRCRGANAGLDRAYDEAAAKARASLGLG